jgi:hypothetical protein
MTPTEVAKYASTSSYALSEVQLEDMLEEIRIRGTETATLYRIQIITDIETLAKSLRETYLKSI